MPEQLQFDEIGLWSEIKLEILKEYAAAYSRILAAQRHPHLQHIYIDAFAGAGVHRSRVTHGFVRGSPWNALSVRPPFVEYHLIDIEPEKIENLKTLFGSRHDVFFYQGNCNQILLRDVFPRANYQDYRRGLCVLDPYGLHLDWAAIFQAGQMRTIDMFLNFPVADMNRNVLWRNPERVDASQAARMTAFWGDASWRDIAYQTTGNLFGYPEKESNDVVAEAFRTRLRDVAGFGRVPKPIPMRNSTGAIIYYLFFASQNGTGEHIVQEIFENYKNVGAR